MHKLLIIGAGLTLAGLAACSGEVDARTTRVEENGLTIKGDTVQTNKRAMRVGSRLECPDKQGDLRLASAAADGRSCAYRSRDGDADVQLQLTALTGPADAQLRTLEGHLRALVPTAAAAGAAPPRPPQPPRRPGEDSVAVEVPGVRVNAQGEHASIRLPGVSIEADEGSADVRVQDKNSGETVSIRANDDGAEIRTTEEPARANGDLRSTYLLTSKQAGPAGWRVAGYKAQGPGSGPLVVGVLRAKGSRDGNLMEDMEELIERNVGR
jgi:hypothetical protein